MKVLFDIGHPAHVHLLKYTAASLKRDGHQVYFSVRDIPVAKRLMQIYGMEYIELGKKKDNLLGKAGTVLHQDWELYRFVRKNRIDFGLSSGIVLPHVSGVTRMKAFCFDDDDDYVEPLVVRFGHPFSDVVFTPDSISRKTGHALYYAGTHELAYLHPNWFTPDADVLQRAGIRAGERFFIMRFVAFKGHHDAHQGGLSKEQKRTLIELMKPYGRVLITSEREEDPEFEPYRVPVPPEDIHSLMSYASLFVGDSQTMTSEAAILGVPAVKCNTFAGRLSVPNELERRYGLCFAYLPTEFNRFYDRVKSLLVAPEVRKKWAEKSERFLAEKIDVSSFFTWFIENYPESKDIMSKDPDYQFRFK